MNIQNFKNFLNESDDKQLLRDLENIGMKDKTFSEQQIRDAFSFAKIEENFDTELVDVGSVELETSNSTSDEITINASYTGRIQGTFDTAEIWKNFFLKLNSYEPEDDYKIKTYTPKEIEDAFDYINWDSFAEAAIEDGDVISDIEYNFSSYEQDSNMIVTASASVDSTGNPSLGDILEDLISNL